jgi:single-strand DNA-binding protein
VFQSLIIVGNLGRDPELRYLSDGKPVTNLSVATNRVYTNAAGEQVKETTWFRVSVFGKQAEACNQYLSKGRLVLVEGSLRADPATGGPRVWQGQDGSHRASFEMTATTVRFLGGRGEGTPGAPGAPGAAEHVGTDATEDEIPF